MEILLSLRVTYDASRNKKLYTNVNLRHPKTYNKTLFHLLSFYYRKNFLIRSYYSNDIILSHDHIYFILDDVLNLYFGSWQKHGNNIYSLIKNAQQ